MSTLTIGDAERRQLATKWVGITMFALHVWATILVVAILFSRTNGEVVSAMFSTVTFGIGATLAILLIDRAADAVLARFLSAPPVAVTETVTRTVTPNEVAAKDISIKAEGDVTVEKTQ